MKVSIVVPNRNYGKYLPACLDSIAAQTYQNIEVLLADGGSTDDSVEIMEDYAKRYGWTIFSYSDNGQIEAISKGLNIATGEIQCWLNSDDIFISKRAIEKVVNKFQDLVNVDIISLGGYYIDEHGKYLRPILLQNHPLFRQTNASLRGGFVQPATFWRKKVFEELKLDFNFFTYCFDTDFFIRANQKFNMVVNQNDYIAGYRITSRNKSVGIKYDRIQEIAKLNEKFFGKGFRFFYIKFIAMMIKMIGYLPKPLNSKISYLVYIINNLLSYITIYHIPSI